MKTVDIAIYPGFKLFEAVGPMTVFHYANRLAGLSGHVPYYSVRLISSYGASVMSDVGVPLDSQALPAQEDAAHTVLVVGGHDILDQLSRNLELIEWTREVAPRVSRFAALCSGAFFLAASGLIDGRRATTHWRMVEAMKFRYPKVDVDDDAIFVQQDNLWTSAGVSASIDLALAFVEEDFGHDAALDVARDLVIFLKRPGGQSQFSADLNAQMTSMSSIRCAQEWMINNLEARPSIPDVAEKVDMSLRTFNRLFLRETGVSPLVFLERSRVDKARRMILQSDSPLKTIAYACGYHGSEQMRVAFQKFLKVSPSEYRQRFCSRRGFPQSTVA